jgi:glycosyltransferase involved in cell wall biosynthesis
MSALPDILKQRPDAQVLIMGLDAGIPGKKGYGQDNPEGVCWRESLLKKYAHQLDTTRVHFLGFRSYATYEALLKISACHVYLTYPFVLSWSFLEAAALGVPTVASDVAPVQEFSHLNNLRFVDFHDTSALSRAIVETLNQPPVCMPNDLSEYDVKSVIPRIKKVLIDPLWLARKNAKHKSSAEIHDPVILQSARKPAHNEPIRLITSKNQPEQPAQVEETPVISKDKAQPDVRAKGKRRTPRRRYTPMVRNKKR